ncbi:MAG TPA: hypothetical protein VJU86_03470 [Pyrinomonadaceae bacterium]|nr:hypothetical protein [Pyrinomonadaceae bacterium]
MKTLRLTSLMILLAATAAAQDGPSTSPAPDVTVVNISWHRVDRPNPRLNDPGVGVSPDYAQRVAVNTARTNTANSERDSGLNPPPPKLLALPSIPDSPPPVRHWSGFIYEFTVKNTGEKTIRHLVFEHSFTDPSTQLTVARRQYKSKVKIRPGTTAKIVVRSSRGPVGTVNARQAGQNAQAQSAEQMIILSMKYDDGSSWQRASK